MPRRQQGKTELLREIGAIRRLQGRLVDRLEALERLARGIERNDRRRARASLDQRDPKDLQTLLITHSKVEDGHRLWTGPVDLRGAPRLPGGRAARPLAYLVLSKKALAPKHVARPACEYPTCIRHLEDVPRRQLALAARAMLGNVSPDITESTDQMGA